MAGEGSLLKKLDDAVNHLRMLEREKSEAVARAAALEQEIKELRGLIAMAESKAEEILKGVPVGPSAKPENIVFPEHVAAAPVAETKVTAPAAAFQDFSDKSPMQNPADTKRRYTQVF